MSDEIARRFAREAEAQTRRTIAAADEAAAAKRAELEASFVMPSPNPPATADEVLGRLAQMLNVLHARADLSHAEKLRFLVGFEGYFQTRLREAMTHELEAIEHGADNTS